MTRALTLIRRMLYLGTMKTAKPLALEVKYLRGQLVYIVHGVITCLTIASALDLLQDRRKQPRNVPMAQTTLVCVEYADGSIKQRWV